MITTILAVLGVLLAFIAIISQSRDYQRRDRRLYDERTAAIDAKIAEKRQSLQASDTEMSSALIKTIAALEADRASRQPISIHGERPGLI